MRFHVPNTEVNNPGLYTYASTSDVDGNITSVNLTAIREKYGNSEFLDYLVAGE